MASSEPAVLVHRNSGICYIIENWAFFTARFKNLEDICSPALRTVNSDGFRRMLKEAVESKPRHGAVRAMLCAIPQSRTTVHRPFAPDNIWNDANLAPPTEKDKELCSRWVRVTFSDLVKVRALLAHVQEQISGANEMSSTAVNVLSITKLSDAPAHQCRGFEDEAINIGGPGDSHNLSFWIEPLLGPAPALLPYMSDTFITDWEKNPLANDGLLRSETPRVWHHPTEGALLGATANNLLNEIGATLANWQNTQRFATYAPPEVRKLHKQRYPDSKSA